MVDGHFEAAIESRGSASVTVERYRIRAKDARGQVTGMRFTRTHLGSPGHTSRFWIA